MARPSASQATSQANTPAKKASGATEDTPKRATKHDVFENENQQQGNGEEEEEEDEYVAAHPCSSRCADACTQR